MKTTIMLVSLSVGIVFAANGAMAQTKPAAPAVPSAATKTPPASIAGSKATTTTTTAPKSTK